MNKKSRLLVIDTPFVLLLKKKDSNEYSLIGGNIEQGESPEEAILREAREEAGISIKPEDITPASSPIVYTKNNVTYERYYFFLKDNKNKDFQLGEPDKFEALEWIDFNDVKQFLKKSDRSILSCFEW